MSDTKLKPCPFCGSEPVEDRIEPHKHSISWMPDYPGSWSIECPTCEFRLFDHDSHANVVAAWNRRVQLAAPAPAPAPSDAWKEAIINEGIVCEIGWDETNPTRSLHDIINWHVAVALDPAVSSAAQALIDRGRNEAQLAAPAPSGYKLVPIEPTHDQCMEAIDVLLTDWWQGVDSDGRKVMQIRECSAHDIYKAMIAAAPTPSGMLASQSAPSERQPDERDMPPTAPASYWYTGKWADK